MERLAATILIQIVQAWQDEMNRAELREFMLSESFLLLTTILDLDPFSIRTKLETGNYRLVDFRSAYR